MIVIMIDGQEFQVAFQRRQLPLTHLYKPEHGAPRQPQMPRKSHQKRLELRQSASEDMVALKAPE
jgi:hypothetical protein